MDCNIVVESLYEEGAGSFFFRLRRMGHLALCQSCAAQARKLEMADNLMRNAFMPPSPDLSDAVMSMLGVEQSSCLEDEGERVSLRGWVAAGFFLLLSLTSAYFGGDFLKIAAINGISFLVPVGITIGVALIAYAGLFVGAHLELLRKKFGIGDRYA
ncbi:MAG: peptidoglycan-binding protein [Spirochaetaceae bacterium]|jgi:hypothetical protein|nr:peptidoglycan-binding protein [Spirochaetaceae bacterium]